jgi:hypothetical protein
MYADHKVGDVKLGGLHLIRDAKEARGAIAPRASLSINLRVR